MAYHRPYDSDRRASHPNPTWYRDSSYSQGSEPGELRERQPPPRYAISNEKNLWIGETDCEVCVTVRGFTCECVSYVTLATVA